ncbi:MAG: hypothetical protein JW807_02505 [Spirochaetes bacterium]|nr:hypothetical protein [Spirochaetota bacterium]
MNRARSILGRCAAVGFGPVDTSGAAVFYQRLNGAVMDFCRSLPESARAGAMIFLMEYAGLRIGEPLDFFKNFYPPAWTVLYWLASASGAPVPLSGEELDPAIGGHAMAMQLHSLDDHLVDGEVPATHLTLMVRGEMWRRMNACIEPFAAPVPGGAEAARRSIDDYYAGMSGANAPVTLDDYCSLFRRQMGTWTVMPVLTAMRCGDGGFAVSLKGAYESFGIAWRLMDDLHDLEEDIARGARSAVHVCLDPEGRELWDSFHRGKKGGGAGIGDLCAMIDEWGIIETLKGRIVHELDNAASTAERLGMAGLAQEFTALAAPLAGRDKGA